MTSKNSRLLDLDQYPPDLRAVLDGYLAEGAPRRGQVPKRVGAKAKPAPAITLYSGRRRPGASGQEARSDGSADRNHGLGTFECKQELRKLANRLSWLERNGRKGTSDYTDVLDRIAALKAAR